jgi:hypothetical protein
LAFVDIWPRIRAQVPDATLDLFYGYDEWRRLPTNGFFSEQIRYFDRKRPMLESLGVTFHPRLSPKEVARKLLSASVWLYPTAWAECWPAVAAQAQCAGLYSVTTDLAALPEMFEGATEEGGSGYAGLLKGVGHPCGWNLEPDYQAAFVEKAAAAFWYPLFDKARTSLRHRASERFGWSRYLDTWENLFQTSATERPPASRSLNQEPKKNLLVICRGKGALELPRESQSTWEGLVVAWHPEGLEQTSGWRCLTDFDRSRRKLSSFAHLVHEGEIDLSHYDRIALVDDDIVPAPGVTWSDIFQLFDRTGFAIAQPALHPRSYVCWPITRQQPSPVLYRETTFVESMTPVFLRSVLEQYLDIFRASGWSPAIDNLWSASERPIGILDATPVIHARPVAGGAAYDGTANLSVLETRFRVKHGLSVRPRTDELRVFRVGDSPRNTIPYEVSETLRQTTV